MVFWARESREVMNDPKNSADVDAMVEFLVSLAGKKDPSLDQTKVERGREILDSGNLTAGSITKCTDCHTSVASTFTPDASNGGIPELSGYGSTAWLKSFITNPGHEQFYGEKNKMPGFADSMSAHDLELLARYLSGDFPPSHVAAYPTLSIPDQPGEPAKEGEAAASAPAESK
jgi:mono/diheme cytochrome c family protein